MQLQDKYVLADCLHSPMIDLWFCGSHSHHERKQNMLCLLINRVRWFQMSAFRLANHTLLLTNAVLGLSSSFLISIFAEQLDQIFI